MAPKKPTSLSEVASRMASGDHKKATQIHHELTTFIAHMAMNDHPELPTDHYQKTVNQIKDQSEVDIKDILNT